MPGNRVGGGGSLVGNLHRDCGVLYFGDSAYPEFVISADEGDVGGGGDCLGVVVRGEGAPGVGAFGGGGGG